VQKLRRSAVFKSAKEEGGQGMNPPSTWVNTERGSGRVCSDARRARATPENNV